ncbi:hypothetical protein PybrP1_013135 [[Pythium] brassicae (nom. inval.)]|nr:hypothetical protein PybrP1_013135 [[Pythium] brassicae (nom. inval.)]
MIPSKAPLGIVMDGKTHKAAPRPALTSPQSAEERDVSAAALARSLAERMQKTYPFAPSPATQVLPRSRGENGPLGLDAIMNATPVAGYPANNENSSQNSEAQLELSPSGSGAGSDKSSLAFILGRGNRAETSGDVDDRHHRRAEDVDIDSEEGEWGGASSDASTDHHAREQSTAVAAGGERPSGKQPSKRRSTASGSGNRGQVKKSRICKFDGCTRYVVNRGLCIGHGGGKRCAIAGCTSSAKNLGVCWKHGGSTKCTVPGCDNRAKSRGVCWTHGGGKNCSGEGCTKTAVSHGLCWAHGGGKRCVVDGCKKPAYERNGNLCSVHQQQQQQQQRAAS